MQITLTDRTKALSDDMLRFARRRLLFALSRFDSKIDRVAVTIDDTNGPRGGVDKSCRILVRGPGVGPIAVSCEESDVTACISRAASRVGRAVSRTIAKNQRFDRRQAAAVTQE